MHAHLSQLLCEQFYIHKLISKRNQYKSMKYLLRNLESNASQLINIQLEKVSRFLRNFYEYLRKVLSTGIPTWKKKKINTLKFEFLVEKRNISQILYFVSKISLKSHNS